MELMRKGVWGALALLMALGLSACGEMPGARKLPPLVGQPETLADDPGTPEEPAALAIALVSSDYAASAIGVLSRVDGGLFHEAVFDSAREASGLSAALSGDVVLPSAPNPFHWLILIDRYPNAAITVLDWRSFSPLRQFSVGTGFSANPQDLLVLDEHTAYVTRLNPNPHPGREPYDEGDDILIVDPSNGTIRGRIAMPAPQTNEAGKRLYWRPCRLRRVGSYVYASLNHLSDDYLAAGEAALARIDPTTHTLDRILTYPGLANPVGLSYDAAKDELYVACNGPYFAGNTAQIAQSGLLALSRASSQEPAWRLLRRADSDPLRRPFGFEIEHFAGLVIAVRNGDLTAGQGDRLVGVDPDSGDEQTLYTTSSAYGSGGLLADRFRGLLYLGDADARAPRVVRLKAVGGRFVQDGATESSPVYGLPPRFLRFY